MTGQKLYDVLREKYHLQMEMAAGNYVVAILTMMDRKEGIRRLLTALRKIDAKTAYMDSKNRKADWWRTEFHPVIDMNLWEAYTMPCEEVILEEAEGRTAAEFINLYPPGIPLLVPGEKVEKQLMEVVLAYLAQGYTVQGVCNNRIKVLMSF